MLAPFEAYYKRVDDVIFLNVRRRAIMLDIAPRIKVELKSLITYTRGSG
jgi:hypothetical protein